jgi:hypothetical protein
MTTEMIYSKFGKRKKPYGATSEEYSGCGKMVTSPASKIASQALTFDVMEQLSIGRRTYLNPDTGCCLYFMSFFVAYLGNTNL